MLAYIIRRLIGAVLMLLLVSLVTFGIFFGLPKLAGQTTDQLAAAYVGKAPTAEAIQDTKERLGLDKPIVVQYGNYLKGIVAGKDYKAGPVTDHCPAPCLGYSYRSSQPVLETLMDRAPATASLALGAAVIWLIGGITTGVISALRRGSLWDRTAMIIALSGVSLPIYFTGLVSLALFSYTLKIFPGGGSYPPEGFTGAPVMWFQSLVLPWVTLAFLYAAMYARLTRAGMLETMNEDYIRTARAKGLPEKTVVTKHALRASLTPILTIFGLDLGLLLGGAVLTENTFGIPGLGQLAISSINGGDLPMVLGITLITATSIVGINLIVDLLYAVVDPRVRLS
ncbi:ABC transporter permease [Actinomadura bangladeshensis]|uniref:ABC transporter permease n=1 Tax=Actinomadura bangladeshensis TaxID=453573 RepID=A0A4R4NVL8_9ACTN|nr:ABC transporter permease [Actinomadura bangladeshensis]TDC13104.1 ABC transporter permease [Actinomadura bangladeshensis]